MLKKIIIEGVDKVGKTTLTKFLQKATNYELYVQDRSEIGQEIYNSCFEGRTHYHADIYKDTLYVLLYCGCNQELEFRATFNEEKIDTEFLSKCQDAYIEYWENHEAMSPNWVEYDISKLGLSAIADDIIRTWNHANRMRG